ncbi:MAG: HAD hydrolase family protein [Deltaproteobacteria bacterium]|nr:HAD hydrolase family protein [Deltaproteobacteria bacterium]MBW2305343.1 HAD hydrolase family protein [Deltaproteobacteria bacterium]
MSITAGAFPPEALKRAAAVQLVVLDVDGVLTDGALIYGDKGEELKIFNVHDGTGLVLLLQAGVKVIWITGRESAAVAVRGKELGVNAVFQGVRDKLTLFLNILKERGLKKEQAACMGDDIHDLLLLSHAGLAVAPSNAQPALKSMAHYVTSSQGGRGAVRELCDLILQAHGKWDRILERFQLEMVNEK